MIFKGCKLPMKNAITAKCLLHFLRIQVLLVIRRGCLTPNRGTVIIETANIESNDNKNVFEGIYTLKKPEHRTANKGPFK